MCQEVSGDIIWISKCTYTSELSPSGSLEWFKKWWATKYPFNESKKCYKRSSKHTCMHHLFSLFAREYLKDKSKHNKSRIPIITMILFITSDKEHDKIRLKEAKGYKWKAEEYQYPFTMGHNSIHASFWMEYNNLKKCYNKQYSCEISLLALKRTHIANHKTKWCEKVRKIERHEKKHRHECVHMGILYEKFKRKSCNFCAFH